MAQQQPRTTPGSRLMPVALFVIIVGALYFARDVLIPVALSILLSFLLTPVVRWLERFHIPRIPAVIIVVVLSFSVIGGLGYVVATQFVDLANKLPQYKDNIRSKIVSLRSPRGGVFDRASDTIRELSSEVTSPTENIQTTTVTATPNKTQTVTVNRGDDRPAAVSATPLEQQIVPPKEEPVPVRVVDGPGGSVHLIGTILGPILSPIGRAGIVILFVVFILLQREDLRDRFILLIGHGRLTVTTQAMDDAARRVSRYLLMQLIVNATYGVPVAIALSIIGVPNAILWGILATLLRFIPYIGPWVAASFPIMLSLAVFDGWAKPIMVVGLFLFLELLSNNILEPLLYGSSTGVTPIALIGAAVFWTWLWGGVGLFLSTPLTVCLVVLGRYVPPLAFLNVLMGDDPGLAAEARFYQRLLAMDHDGATNIIDRKINEPTPVQSIFDDILIPALSLAEADRHRGYLDQEHATFVYHTIEEIIEDIGERDRLGDTTSPEVQQAEAELAARPAIICLPARDEADELAAAMAAQLISASGRARGVALTTDELASEMMDRIEKENATVALVSALPPYAVTHARYLCKRLRARFPTLRIVVGMWNAPGELVKATQRITAAGGNDVVTTTEQALGKVGA